MLSHISNRPRVAYLVLVTLISQSVAMWDRFFRQRAYIGITRSRMRWYVRKNYLTWVKTAESPIWCARMFLSKQTAQIGTERVNTTNKFDC